MYANPKKNNLDVTIAVVIPAFNVQNHIKKVITQTLNYASYIVVIDDGSKDKTADVVKSIKDTRIHLVQHEKNRGLGNAMLSGYSLAYDLGAEIMVKIDGDDQMDPSYMRSLITPILQGKADYTKGNRFLHPKELQTMPLIRRIGNLGMSFLTKLASGYWYIFDPTNGYTAIHRKAYELLNKEKIACDFFFEASLLILLHQVRAVVQDVPIPAIYNNQESNLSPIKTLFTFPPRLLKYSFQRIIYQYFLYDFTAVSIYLIVGLPCIIFGFIWGLAKWYQSHLSGVVTSTGTVLIAVLPIIIGIQFLTSAVLLDISSSPSQSIQSAEALFVDNKSSNED